jgi:hypothetical protein
MGRPRKKIDVLGEGPALLKRLKKEKRGWQRERLLVIKRVLEGEESQCVADELERSQAPFRAGLTSFVKAELKACCRRERALAQRVA